MSARVGTDGPSPRQLAAVAFAVTLVGIAAKAVGLLTRRRIGLDFDVYRAAGSAVLHGESVAAQMHRSLPFTYPPLAAVFAVPFALVDRVVGFAVWNAASILCLVAVLRFSLAPLLRRVGHPVAATTLAVLAAVALTPVMDVLWFGQVGLVLMAMCFFDCVLVRTPWPRGLLIGVATAIKLLPGIFIPYLWLTGRRRAALIAAATAAVMTVAGFAVLPNDSETFWTSHVFDSSRVGDTTYFSNQSLNGMLRRALGERAHWLFIALAVVVAAYGLTHAVRASRRGDELLGVSMTALVGILVSPVSWIHHLVWIVPILALLIGDGTSRRRVAIAVSFALAFALYLPYLGQGLPQGWMHTWVAAPLKDAYGVMCLVLLFALPKLVATPSRPDGPPRPVPAVLPSSSPAGARMDRLR